LQVAQQQLQDANRRMLSEAENINGELLKNRLHIDQFRKTLIELLDLIDRTKLTPGADFEIRYSKVRVKFALK
jgi:hypothetical protein